MDDDATRRRPPGSTPALVAMTDADGVVTYTVGELTGAINSALRDAFGGGVWVVGEISGLTVRGPHTYFSLVEEVDGEKASMNVQFFAYAKKALRPLLAQHRLELTDGTRIRIKGTLDVYAPTGRLGLKLSDIDPQFTLGDISAARDAVLRQLAADGLLERNAQVPMPTVPLHIGVVTSVGSAAWHDLTDQLVSSGVGFQISAVDARVQGDDAPAMVAAGITILAARGVDVVVVVRGGGARNELAAFDTAEVARAIAQCPVPVLTGIGHEIDHTVADDVAHSAYKTPTAVAGALVDMVRDAIAASETMWRDIVTLAQTQMATAASDLGTRAHRVAGRTHAAVSRSDERLRARRERLVGVRALLDRTDVALRRRGTEVARMVPDRLRLATERLDALERRRAAVDPAHLLARGWSITTDASGEVVRSVADVASGDVLTTRVADGVVTTQVTDATPRPQ